MDHENIYQAPVATLTPATVNLDDKSLITPPETSLRNTDGQILPITITEQDDTVMAEPGVTHKEDTIDTWNFQPQEEIDLLSVRDGNDDMTVDHISTNEPDIQEINGVPSPPTSVPDAIEIAKLRQKVLEKQREYCEKFRKRTCIQDAASMLTSPAQIEKTAEPPLPVSRKGGGDGKKARGKDSMAEEFQKLKAQYNKRKNANKLTIDEEIAFISAESAESARLRKLQEAEESHRAAFPEHEDIGHTLFVTGLTPTPAPAPPAKVKKPRQPPPRGYKRGWHPGKTGPKKTHFLYTEEDMAEVPLGGRVQSKPNPKWFKLLKFLRDEGWMEPTEVNQFNGFLAEWEQGGSKKSQILSMVAPEGFAP